MTSGDIKGYLVEGPGFSKLFVQKAFAQSFADRNGLEVQPLALTAQPAEAGVTVKALWQELLEKDDRTSPAKCPNMALITFDELAALAEALVAEQKMAIDEAREGKQASDDEAASAEDRCVQSEADRARLAAALTEAIAVFDGMADDEIGAELLPRLRSALHPTPAPQGMETAVEAEPTPLPFMWLSQHDFSEMRMPASPNRSILGWRQHQDRNGNDLVPLYATPQPAPSVSTPWGWVCSGEGDGWKETDKLVRDPELVARYRGNPNWHTIVPLYTQAAPSGVNAEMLAALDDFIQGGENCSGPVNGIHLKHLREWRRAIAAAETQPAAVGWQLVPVEPTEAMLDAYWMQTGESTAMRARTHAYIKRYYQAMLSASPKPGGGQ